jgi:hypothetical protein
MGYSKASGNAPTAARRAFEVPRIALSSVRLVLVSGSVDHGRTLDAGLPWRLAGAVDPTPDGE